MSTQSPDEVAEHNRMARKGVVIHMDKMTFPNFLKVREWDGEHYPVALLTDEQASAFWDEQKPKWLAHVAARRKARPDLGEG